MWSHKIDSVKGCKETPRNFTGKYMDLNFKLVVNVFTTNEMFEKRSGDSCIYNFQ